MQDVINLLPDHVANQIAAGEVVQRSASVVKELLENAIDAGATNIQLIVKEAGRQLIQVTDNGFGMSPTDARISFERHTTSKIHTTEDIFHINTKGFRGEALASIAAVAQVEMKTKRETDDLGTELHIHGGQVKLQEAAVCPTGTTISVKNLFYNVPARRNFLKSNHVELKHILDEFHRIALAHESVELKLTHNNNELFHLIKTQKIQRIMHVFGKKMEGNLVPVKEETDLVKISGYAGKPEIAKKSRGEQFFFVNNRFIRSNYLHKAVQEAFDNLIAPGYYPSYFLFLEMDASKIDINIHPTKTEIKFEDDYAIYAMLRAAVKHTLGQYQVMPTLDFDQYDWEIPEVKTNKAIQTPNIKVNRNYNPFQSVPKKIPDAPSFEQFETLSPPTENPSFLPLEENENIDFQTIQWRKGYIVTVHQGDLIVIDQHRAHQKILYEQFIQKSQQNTLSQQLLFPIEIPLNAKEMVQLEATEEYWIHFGFDLEKSNDLLTIKAIPAELNNDSARNALTDYLSEEFPTENSNPEKALAKSLAKSSAIQKDTALSAEECVHLAQQLFELKEPNYSPFGKRVFWQIGIDDVVKFLS